jgi:tetratricopeptide (TPR) repeat protein
MSCEEYIEITDEDIVEVREIDAGPGAGQGVRVACVHGGDLDSQTELDLAVGFWEMGLLNDALTHFRKVLHLSGRQVFCHMMIGRCYRDLGRVPEAIRELKDGLFAESVTRKEELELFYELGRTYEEKLRDDREALYYYDRVVKQQPNFRDVRRRIAHLAPRAQIRSGRRPREDRTPLFRRTLSFNGA